MCLDLTDPEISRIPLLPSSSQGARQKYIGVSFCGDPPEMVVFPRVFP